MSKPLLATPASKLCCTCCDASTPRQVIESRHGNFKDFVLAVFQAVPSFISLAEADAACVSYGRALIDAPEGLESEAEETSAAAGRAAASS